jgi:hypothetical protein
LSASIRIDGITLQHIPKALSPNMQSAPKDFRVLVITLL